jgi:hypothetical protein
MPQNVLVHVNLDVFVGFFVIIAALIALLLWREKKKVTARRHSFFDQFDFSTLRMSPTKIGLVYRVEKADEKSLTVLPIWDGKSPVSGGREIVVSEDKLIPFDADRFF